MKSLRDYGDNARGSPKASRTPGPDEAVSPVATSPLGGNAVVPKNQWQRLEDLGISDKHIEKWTKDDIGKILGGGFEQISENHLKLGGFLDQLVKGHAMTREDANIVKLVYAQSNAQYLPEMVKAHRSVIKSQQGKKYKDAAGLAEFWPSKPDYIQAKSKVHMISSGRIEPARVLIHELAHIVWYEANHGKNIHHQNLVTEFRAISKNQGTENFRDWFKSSGDRNAEYHAGRTKDAGPDPSVEQFAEFMSRSLLDRKIPPGAVGGAFTKAMSWLRDMLTRLKSAVGLDDKTRKRLDKIVDELGGFDNSSQMAPVPAPGAKPPAPPSVPRKAPPPLSVPGPPVMIGPPSKNSYPAAPSNPKPLGPLTETEAAKIFGEMLYAYGVIGKFDSQATSVAGVASSGTGPGSLREFLGGVQRPDNPAINAKRVAQKAAGVHPDTNWNLLNARGVDGRTESSFGLLAAGEEIGHFVEGLNRVAPFLNLLKKGYSPEEAAKRVGAAQILYSNKNFTPFEQAYMTRLFPFYKFTSRVAPYIMKQLMEHPGGAYAQAVRAQKNAQDAGDIAPDYVRETASIPVKEGTMLGGLLGTPPEGTDRYITGLGLMHEDPFSFGPNAKGAGLEMLSRMNPLIKGPLEAATGQSFFQKGVDGGRRLDDLDPLLGRLASNLGQNVGLIPPGPTDPEKFPGWLEQAAANSPFTRALSSARILSDPRKGWAAALTPLLTGVRLTDVSPGSKDALIRDLLQRAEKDAGASVFERVYFSDEDKAKMSKSEREEAEKLEALANVLAQRAKDRKKEKQSQTGR